MKIAAGTRMMGDMNDAAVFVVESVDEVPEDVLLRAALKGLTVMSRLSFQTMGTQGALLKFHAYLAMRKQWFISEGVRRKHPFAVSSCGSCIHKCWAQKQACAS